LIVPPRALTELVPLLCRSLRKLFKNDCKAAVPVVSDVLVAAVVVAPDALDASVEEPEPLELPPVRAVTSVLNAVLRDDKLLEDRPDDPVDELSS
jgi:hypothetical protein